MTFGYVPPLSLEYSNFTLATDPTRAHLDAGADHVGIQVLSEDPFPLADLSALAERLL